MIPHPILNSRRDDVSAIELRSIQHIDCTIHHFAPDAVKDEGGYLPHDSRAGKIPCRVRSGSPSPCKLGETKASTDAKVSLRQPPSEINACTNAFVSPGLSRCNLSETKVSKDAKISLRPARSKTMASVHALVSLGLFLRKPSEPNACMNTNISLRTALSKTLASMHANVSPGLFHRKRSETNASMDAMISLSTAPSETKAFMHTFVSLRSHPHSLPQDEASAFMDAPDKYGPGAQRSGPVWMNRHSDEVGSVALNRFRRNRSRIEAHRRLNRSPSHASTHRLVRRIGQDGSTTR